MTAKALVLGWHAQHLAYADVIVIEPILSSDAVKGHAILTAQTKQGVASADDVISLRSGGFRLH